MTVAYKVLGQSTPSAATETTLYTCPSSTQTVLSYVAVCNRSATPTAYRLGIDVDGAGDDNKDFQHYDTPIGANETHYVDARSNARLDRSHSLLCDVSDAQLHRLRAGKQLSGYQMSIRATPPLPFSSKRIITPASQDASTCGMIATAHANNTTQAWPGANDAIAVPFVLPRAVALRRLSAG